MVFLLLSFLMKSSDEKLSNSVIVCARACVCVRACVCAAQHEATQTFWFTFTHYRNAKLNSEITYTNTGAEMFVAIKEYFFFLIRSVTIKYTMECQF